jgi:cytochrome c553
MQMPPLSCILIVLIMAACTSNSEEELYGDEESSCDTTNVSFSNDVFPIIDNNCLACHGTGSPPLGISLTSYSEIKHVASSSRFLGAIKHQQGYTPMPQNAPKLSDCKIATLEAWVNDGMPDN